MTVECHSGYDYAGRPIAFDWEGERMQVARIVQAWREPGKKCFLVSTEDEQLFNLQYEERENLWNISQP